MKSILIWKCMHHVEYRFPSFLSEKSDFLMNVFQLCRYQMCHKKQIQHTFNFPILPSILCSVIGYLKWSIVDSQMFLLRATYMQGKRIDSILVLNIQNFTRTNKSYFPVNSLITVIGKASKTALVAIVSCEF